MKMATPLSAGGSGRSLTKTVQSSTAQIVLQDLLHSSVLLAEDWESVPAGVRDDLTRCTETAVLLPKLVEQGLLTEYQAARINAGKTFGLILGNYRVINHLGAGGMGNVYKAEHLRMRRPVAIKVLPLAPDQSPQDLTRFYAEVRAVAQLQHPNIVAALDAGEVSDTDPDAPVLHYFVMEYVDGKDLEDYIRVGGPLPAAKACDLVYQIARALAEAHKYHLVHRDIKPSNVLVTAAEQAKLLDFGLVRNFRSRTTEPGVIIGTIDYMAPEQARDASAVDIRADLYGLGGTLFWCLTGRPPFESRGNIAQDLARRLTMSPPSARSYQPDIPSGLDAVIARMMAGNPDERYPTPQAVMSALLPFIKPASREGLILASLRGTQDGFPPTPAGGDGLPSVHRVLIVDDEASIRLLCRRALEGEEIQCDEAADGLDGLARFGFEHYDLVLLDIDMPKMTGLEVCRHLRETPPSPHLKIVMFSGQTASDDLARMLSAGADDYLTKPFTVTQLRARIKAALNLKVAQDRSDLLNRHLLAVNHQLELNINARDSDLVHARNALVLSLAKLVECRDTETGNHLVRLQRYCRTFAEEAACQPTFASQIDPNFVQMLECCSPLHDIGKVGLPDHILLKPGKLDPDERIIMQAHTIIGAETLKEVIRHHGSAVAFLQMAIDIARHHHEHYDGTGYPDKLAGSAIPLAAHLLSVCDVYDALRCRRVYKPALPHSVTMQMMTESFGKQFDPALAQPFQTCASRFERIFREFGD